MPAGKGLMSLRQDQLDQVCRRLVSPHTALIDHYRPQSWWQRLGTEPVDIHEYAGEYVIDHSRHHWLTPLVNMAEMSTVTLVAGAFSLLMSALPWDLFGLQFIMWMCTIAHNAWMARHLLRWRADLIILTNWRLIRTGGILSSGVKNYRLDTIGNFNHISSVWAKILGFRDLRVIQSGGTHNQGADDEYCSRVPVKMARTIESWAIRPPTYTMYHVPVYDQPHW